ncbi:MAG: PocR ligand-binding domain-containing protein [Candidatus Riflebacteria bacterium]|nr:PocR ligand-binding domain-containing protein [Candidatus Riflebacteria bacterium]
MSGSNIRNVNATVSFASGHVPEVLKKLEHFLGVALSLRSTSGEVVCKTDYFFGPCSIIRGTDRGRARCRKTYKNIEDRLLRRKVPFVNVCYAGFLIFAVPLEFRGEMVGTLLGSQILPIEKDRNFDLEALFGHTTAALDMRNTDEFYKSFGKVRTLKPDLQRITFLQYLEDIGNHFISMAFADKSWDLFLKEIKTETPQFGRF